MTVHAALLRVLARIELLQWRGWLRELRRDAGFAAAALIVLAFAVGLVFRLGQTADDKGGLALAVAFGVLIFDRALSPADAPNMRALAQGALHPWLTENGALTQWRYLRAGLLSLIVMLTAALVVAMAQPARAPMAAIGALTGAMICAAARYASGDRFRLTITIRGLVRNLRRSRSPILLRSILLRRLRPYWRWIVAACGLGVGVVIVRFGHAPGGALAAFDAAALLLFAYAAAPNAILLRFLARQPIALRRILARYVLWPSLAVWPIAFFAAVLARLPWFGAVVGAGLVALALAVWLGLNVGYALTRSPRGAAALVATDLGVALLLKFGFQFGLLSLVWLLFRLAVLYRAVPRRRWRDTP